MRPLLLAALLLAAPAAHAAKPSPGQSLLDDATAFREALPSVAANLTLEQQGRLSSARLVTSGDATTLTDAEGQPVQTEGGTASRDLALLLLALSGSNPADGFGAISCRLAPKALGLFLFAHPGESLIVARVGDLNRCWLGLEPELGRPREWAIRLDGLLWMARIPAYSNASNGWFPERVEVVRNGEPVIVATVNAVAPSPDSLPPLAAPAANPIAPPAPSVPTERAPRPSPLRLPL